LRRAQEPEPLFLADRPSWEPVANDPSFGGASWQSFEPELPWRLDAERGEVATVYVLFRDEADNESVGPEVGMILYTHPVYLPLVLRAP
jgi:hypothetical protein